MSDWKTDKDKGPWSFSPQVDKPHYNEGNLISDMDNSVWNSNFTKKKITPTHKPWCGYWFNRAVGHSGGDGVNEPPDSPFPIPEPTPNPRTCIGCFDKQTAFTYCPNGSNVTVTPEIVCDLDPLDNVSLYSGLGSVGLHSGNAIFTPGAGGPVIIQFVTTNGFVCWVWGDSLSHVACCGSPIIGYTTDTMGMGETQELTVDGILGSESYDWELVGPGTLTPSGTTAQYSTPSLNEDCDTKATINLYCDGELMDSLEINFTLCSGTIGYTSLQMHVDEEQGLYVVDPIPGYVYDLELHGPGTLEQTVPGSWLYTSPHANPDCDNPNFELKCCENTLDSITIAINSSLLSIPAYQDGVSPWLLCIPDPNCPGIHCGCPSPDCLLENCGFALITYDCENNIITTDNPVNQVGFCAGVSGTCAQQSSANDRWGVPHTYQDWIDLKLDVRSPAQIADGCCPSGLL